MNSRIGAVLVGAGLLVIMIAAVVAADVQSSWFDVDESCRELGRCPGPDTDAALRTLGSAQAVGVAAVVVGIVLRVRALPADGPGPDGVERAALVSGIVGAALALVFGPLALIALFFGPHALFAVVVAAGSLQAAAVTALLTADGPATRAARTAGPLAGAVALPTTGAIVLVPLLSGGSLGAGTWGYVLLHGIVSVAVVLLVGRGVGVQQAAALLVLVAGGIGIGVRPVILDRDDPPPAVAAAPSWESEPLPAPTEIPPAPEPVAPEPPAPEPVVADVACDPAELTWSTTGWDHVMGRGIATVVARHEGAAPCFVEASRRCRSGRAADPDTPQSLTVRPNPGGRWDAGYVTRLVDDAELDPTARVGALSGGQRSRLALALALGRQIEAPDLAVPDCTSED